MPLGLSSIRNCLVTISSLVYGDIEYMPGRSVTSVLLCPLITPSFLSTVTPGKLPTCWFEPVSWLNSVVLPQFWFPTSAKVIVSPSGKGRPSVLTWYIPPSPSPGCSASDFLLRSFSSPAASLSEYDISSISIFSASATLSVSSYPCILNSMGSPIGASFISFISAPGTTPISRKCCLRAPWPPTVVILALFPISRSFNNIYFSCRFQIILV